MKQPEQKETIIIQHVFSTGLHVYSELDARSIRDVPGVLLASRSNPALILVDLDPRYDAEEIIAAIKALAEELPE